MEKKLVLHQVEHSPSSIFSKEDVLRIVESVDENPIKVYQIEVKQEPTVSLFDFLGYPAGAKLGKEVASAAVNCGEAMSTKQITTRTYTGSVLMYRRQFLEEFFYSKGSPDGIEISISDIQDYS